MKKVIIIIVLGVVGMGIAAALIINQMFGAYNDYMAELEIHDVTLESVEDGVYYGSSNAGGVVVVDVEVTIVNHCITDIVLLKHDNGRGSDAEVMPERVLAAQSLMVDTVSGATNSSLVILDAIENALTN